MSDTSKPRRKTKQKSEPEYSPKNVRSISTSNSTTVFQSLSDQIKLEEHEANEKAKEGLGVRIFRTKGNSTR